MNEPLSNRLQYEQNNPSLVTGFDMLLENDFFSGKHMHHLRPNAKILYPLKYDS